MVLFTPNQTLQKYESVNDIIELFCSTRIIYYIKRKNSILQELENQLVIYNNKIRFINAVMNDELILRNRSETVIINELTTNLYTTQNGCYDYLLRLQIRSFTSEKIEILNNEFEKLNQQIETVKNLSPKQIWINELEELKIAYNNL